MHELNLAPIAVFSVCVVVWGLVSARLERRDVSAPIAFVVLGVVVTHGPTAVIHFNLHSSTIRTLAEFSLALVLSPTPPEWTPAPCARTSGSLHDCSVSGCP